MKRSLTFYTINAFLTQFVPFLGVTFLARILSLSEFGILAMVQVLGLFTSQLCHLGMIMPFERTFFDRNDSGDFGKFFSTILFFTSFNTILLAFFLYWFTPNISALLGIDPAFRDAYVVSHFSESLSLSLYYFLSYFRNNHDSRSFFLVSTSNSLLTYVTAIALLLRTSYGFMSLLLAQLAIRFILFVVVAAKLRHVLKWDLSFTLIQDALKISLPALPRTILTVANSNFDKFILNNYMSPIQVGYLSMSQKIGEMSNNLNVAIDNTYQPYVYKWLFEKEKGGHQKIGSFLEPFFFFATAVVLLVCLFSTEIIAIFAGEKYSKSAELVSYLYPHYTLIFFGKQNQISYSKKTHFISIFFLIKLILNVLLMLFMVRTYGVYGAVITTSIVAVIMFFITQSIHQRLVPIDWKKNAMALSFTIGLVINFGMLIMLKAWKIGRPESIALKIVLFATFIFFGLGRGYFKVLSKEFIKKYEEN